MTLRHLKIFLAVYEAKSMTGAAKKLYITQPSVSQAIAELEAHYGAQLFNRLGKRIVATTYAEKMRLYAQNVLNAMTDLKAEMGETERAITLRVGASITLGETFFSPLLQAFLQQNPVYAVQSTVNTAERIEEAVAQNRLDMGLVASARIENSAIKAEPLLVDDLVLVYHEKHPLNLKSTVTADALKDMPLLIREKGSRVRQVVDDLKIAYTATGEYSSAEALLKAVKCNLGVSVVPHVFLSDYGTDGLRFAKIDHPAFRINYWIIYKKTDENDPSVSALIYHCKKFIKQFAY